MEKSPFVLVFEKVGIPCGGHVQLRDPDSDLSAANSGLYASGRMLWSLSNEEDAAGLLCQSQ
ncbi:hypothetical protein MJ579_06285 [Klebsiella pneumoniae]|nr:hypothetical protein MJ579_06285 [Klebsiella pneumoniae]